MILLNRNMPVINRWYHEVGNFSYECVFHSFIYLSAVVPLQNDRITADFIHNQFESAWCDDFELIAWPSHCLVTAIVCVYLRIMYPSCTSRLRQIFSPCLLILAISGKQPAQRRRTTRNQEAGGHTRSYCGRYVRETLPYIQALSYFVNTCRLEVP